MTDLYADDLEGDPNQIILRAPRNCHFFITLQKNQFLLTPKRAVASKVNVKLASPVVHVISRKPDFGVGINPFTLSWLVKPAACPLSPN